MNDTSTLPWQKPDWLPEVESWIQDTMPASQTITGEIEPIRNQPWSTVLAIPTNRGRIYFKACASMLSHEPGLTAKLVEWQPDCMPTLLGINPSRGWMLMKDSGTRLREVIAHEGTLTRWHTILPIYAKLQMQLMDRPKTLLSLGAFDRRLSILPDMFELLLADEESLMLGKPEGITSAEFERLLGLQNRFAQMCADLASLEINETIHHDDFHDANVLVLGRNYTFIDWGESCVTHPFFTLVVTLRSIAWQQEIAEDGPEITALRDSYLRPWTEFAPLNELIEGFEMAYQLGMISRCLTWHHMLQHFGRAKRAEHAVAVPAYLQEYLTATDRFA